MAPLVREATVLSPRSTDTWGALGKHLLETDTPEVWGSGLRRQMWAGQERKGDCLLAYGSGIHSSPTERSLLIHPNHGLSSKLW